MDNFNEKILDNLAHHLSKIKSSIDGIGALLRAANMDLAPIESKELWGLGELFKSFSHEIEKVIDVLVDSSVVDQFKEFAPKKEDVVNDDDEEKKEGEK